MNQTRRRTSSSSNNGSRKPNSSGNNTFDSQGPDGKIRGTAHQIFEKYMALARDANSSGDRIAAESFYQFADHYFRLMTPDTETEGNSWRDESHRQPKSHSFQQNAFAAEMEISAQPSTSSGERIESAVPKSTRGPGERSGGRENRFENRRSRHPYLGGNSRSYGDRQNRSEQSSPQAAVQESLPLESQPEKPSEPKQDIITVIQ
ncbi:MAG: hypothetical protein B7Y25_04620 [Alphaproteobacteria bacterium 16-39-46]|nr:MAG: hypothetical protein B7Y25_04620 [Alphaproteobacteria bacterium 16-39-46]OZA42939.1 MAG: hypothetical protein B7X84_04445 [Alphaproteobacteria bacterium 17-39-52]HQS84208.1 DUF4167 domain-containing protein [Alphaproteobacteria bacterium]HQS94056.1 DUF4167 domain-containing protein [Alphaproteobacteria bacterium]